MDVMPFQLNPSKVPIWRSETDLKLGTAETDQLLEEVSTAQERLINLLFQGIAEDQLELVGESVGLASDETNQLIERLKPSLLEQQTIAGKVSSFDARFAEVIRIGFESNSTAESVLAQRASTQLLIPQLDRTGLLISKTLAEAGFRQLMTTDYEVVGRGDLGELGYQADQLGLPRLSAARVILESNGSQVQLTHQTVKNNKQTVAIVLSGMHRIQPQNYRNLSTPHIAIEYGIDEIRISAIIQPGISACLGCKQLWESESDPNWITTSIQLSGRHDQLDDGVGLLMATAIAAKTLCRFVDLNQTNGNTGYRVNLKTRVVSELSWQPHPNCLCLSKSFEPGR
jgi:hypothetical protein